MAKIDSIDIVEPVSEKTCFHHWIISDPDGPTSSGKCKLCGTQRDFMNYFLITGMPKSGTTWVQRICRAHPEMYCRTEDQFTKFWSKISELLGEYNDLVDLRDKQRDKQGVEPLNRTDGTKLFFAMIKIALEKAPEDAVWSGIKDLSLSATGFMSYLPGSRVVNVIRDPRDTAISAWAHNHRVRGTNSKEFPPLDNTFLMETVKHWMDQLNLAETATAQTPNQTYDIRYEDLIEDFPTAVSRLLLFFDLDRTNATVEALRQETDFTRLSGGRAPGQIDESSYFRKGLAGDWRSTLSDAQVAMVHDICAVELKANGYNLD